VIEEIVTDQVHKNDEPKEKEAEEEESRVWTLHEDLFKNNSKTVVNPEHLKKSSAQMYAVYKYYGDLKMKVKNKSYTGTDEFVEVQSLVTTHNFFDAPDKLPDANNLMVESH